MKRILLLLGILLVQVGKAETKEVYVFIWASTQTESGAGHSSLAFKSGDQYDYYSHYRKADGGGINIQAKSIDSLMIHETEILGMKTTYPSLILKFKVTGENFKTMKEEAQRKIKRKWSLFGINCTDFVKQIFRESRYDTGLAFAISTPYEMIKDISDHNSNYLTKGDIQVVEGELHGYLNNQPRAVPYTLRTFFKNIF